MHRFTQACLAFQAANDHLPANVVARAAGEAAQTPTGVFLKQAALELKVSLVGCKTKADFQSRMYEHMVRWAEEHAAVEPAHGSIPHLPPIRPAPGRAAPAAHRPAVRCGPAPHCNGGAVSPPRVAAAAGAAAAAHRPPGPRNLSAATVAALAAGNAMYAAEAAIAEEASSEEASGQYRPPVRTRGFRLAPTAHAPPQTAAVATRLARGSASVLRVDENDAEQMAQFMAERGTVVQRGDHLFMKKKPASIANGCTAAQKDLYYMLGRAGIEAPTWDKVATVVLGHILPLVKAKFDVMSHADRKRVIEWARVEGDFGDFMCFDTTTLLPNCRRYVRDY
jgi:hypothetical protein